MKGSGASGVTGCEGACALSAEAVEGARPACLGMAGLGGLRPHRVPVGQDAVVVGLDHPDREGEDAHDEPGNVLGRGETELIAEGDQPEPVAAVDASVLVELVPLDQVGYPLDVELEELPRAGDHEGAPVAPRFGPAPAGEARLAQELPNRGRARDAPHARRPQEGPQARGA